MTTEEIMEMLKGLNYSEVERQCLKLCNRKVTSCYIGLLARGLKINPTIRMLEDIAIAAKAVRADMNRWK